MGFFDQIFGKDHFEEGVEQTSQIPVLFIDPKKQELTVKDWQKYQAKLLDPNAALDDPEILRVGSMIGRDADRLKISLEEQHPGITASLAHYELSDMVIASAIAGPYAMKLEHEGQNICVVNKPAQNVDEKHEIASALSGMSITQLGHVPGTDALWQRVLGIHEGEHCNQETLNRDGLSGDEVGAAILTAEAKADRAAMDDLNLNGHTEMTQALHDYRALKATKDPIHATSTLADDKGEITATVSHLHAAEDVETDIILDVSDKLNITREESLELRESNPQKFLDTMEEIYNETDFSKVPDHVREQTEDYIGAYRRQIVDPDPEPAETELDDDSFLVSKAPLPEGIDGGKPEIIAGAYQDKMSIGGVSASEYFASHADPEMAQQRLEFQQQQALDAGNEVKVASAPSTNAASLG